MKKNGKRALILTTIMLSGMSLTACREKDVKDFAGFIIEREESIEFGIENGNVLVVKRGEEKYYVRNVSELKNEKLSHGKSSGVLVKNSETGELIVRYDFHFENGMTAMINGIDLKKKLIWINDLQYQLALYDEKLDNALDINLFFPNSLLQDREKLTLNPKNYEEFIDADGNNYERGAEVKEADIRFMLYPVELNGKSVFSITFDTSTGERYGFKEKALMLKDGEAAKKIKTVDYDGIYETASGELAVNIGGKYCQLHLKKEEK